MRVSDMREREMSGTSQLINKTAVKSQGCCETVVVQQEAVVRVRDGPSQISRRGYQKANRGRSESSSGRNCDENQRQSGRQAVLSI